MVKRAISNIGRVLTQQQTEIMSVATMLIVIGMINKVFGLLFNSVAAGFLGTSAYNSFLFASNIPELMAQIILFGAITATILPILSKILEEEGKQRFIRVFSSLINISIIIFLVFAVVIALTAGTILPWFIENVIRAKNEISPEQMSELVTMLRVMMIPQIILAISIYLTTALNIYERFLIPQLAPVFYNLGRILSIYILIPFIGQTPWVLVWGSLVGSVLHLLIQVPVVRHLGLGYVPVFDFFDKQIRDIGTIALPRIMSISVEQIGVFIDKLIAFGLAGDALAFYTLGVLIISVPLSIFGSSYSTASFPSLARAFNRGERIIASQIFTKIMNQILFLSIPSAIILIILRVPIVRLAFGIFGDQVDFLTTLSISWVILFFAPGIIFESLRTLLYRTFYATHDTVRPLIMSIFVLVFGAITGILFTNFFSHFNTFDWRNLYFSAEFFLTREEGISAVAGLALSSTLVFTIEAIILIIWLNFKYLKLNFLELFGPISRKLIAGGIMAVSTYATYKIWASLNESQYTIGLIVLTISTMLVSILIYLGSSWALRVSEVNVYLDFIINSPKLRIFRRFANFDPIPEDN
jgi:putative peptidoglycan lipid II flippase